jgi:hypothetical protein
MSEIKPLTKIEWMKRDMAKEGFYPTEQVILRVLDGEEPEFFEPAMIDIILETGHAWDDSNQ